MDRSQLRATQAPLKARYREEPTRALIHLHAEGQLGTEEVSCSVETGQAMIEAGLHPSTGGDGTHACSGDMLLQALVACAGVTLRSVATNRGIAVEGRMRAEGDLDVRGTLGIDREAPVGFAGIRLLFDLETSASAEEVADLIATTERYCVVLQTLVSSPEIEVTVTSKDTSV
jgi:uncharacterized OsmC-like protein